MIRKREMQLVNTNLLGTGYKLLGDNLSTSTMLFCNLLQQKFRACGTIQTNLIGYPKSKTNSLSSKSPQGSIRWLRNDSILFLQWKDTRYFFVFHSAHSPQRGRCPAEGQRWRWAVDSERHPCSTSSKTVQLVCTVYKYFLPEM